LGSDPEPGNSDGCGLKRRQPAFVNSQVAMYPNRIRVLVVDDHPVLREGVAVLVSQQPDLLMVGEASTGQL
jgi:hypothetical protein